MLLLLMMVVVVVVDARINFVVHFISNNVIIIVIYVLLIESIDEKVACSLKLRAVSEWIRSGRYGGVGDRFRTKRATAQPIIVSISLRWLIRRRWNGSRIKI